MATITVELTECTDPGTGERCFSPSVESDESPERAGPRPVFHDPEPAIAAIEAELEERFDPTRDVILATGRWYVTITEAIDRLRFAFAVNAAPSLPTG